MNETKKKHLITNPTRPQKTLNKIKIRDKIHRGKWTKPTTQASTAWLMESHSLPDMTGTKLWEYLFFQVGAFELMQGPFCLSSGCWILGVQKKTTSCYTRKLKVKTLVPIYLKKWVHFSWMKEVTEDRWIQWKLVKNSPRLNLLSSDR